MKNKGFKFFLVFISIFILAFSVHPIMFSNKSVVCARFKHFSKIRGADILVYTFQKNNKVYEGNFNINSRNPEELKALEKSDCIEVEVSNYWAWFNRKQE